MRSLISLMVLSLALCFAGFTSAQNGYQRYAKTLCLALRQAYGGKHDGYTITFKACKVANYDPVAHQQLYWVWFKSLHRHQTMLALVKLAPDGELVEGPYELSRYQYDYLKTPAPTA